jgi:transcriptional regulator with XRE-family HTH domain
MAGPTICVVDNNALQRKYPFVPKRRRDAGEPRFQMFGSVVAALRRKAGLDQRELARRVGVSVDQVGRIERGENVGLWYVAAVVAVLYPLNPVEAAEHSLVPALSVDGKEIIRASVLTRAREAELAAKQFPPKTRPRAAGASDVVAKRGR